MLPDLEPDTPSLPQGAVDLGGGYILLWAQDETRVILRGKQADALHAFMDSESQQTGRRLPDNWEPKYIHWARLHLPNLQMLTVLGRKLSMPSMLSTSEDPGMLR
jgi:hypothetical protein